MNDENGFNFKANLFVEQLLGEQTPTGNMFGDWIVGDWSSTLEIGFTMSLGSAELDQRVLEILLEDESVAAYVRGITDLGSPENPERIRRQEAYFRVRNI